MSRSPKANKTQASTDAYLASWNATMQLLREGKSFSGNERNCAFLNCGGSPFANISAISGLDFPDDGRAVAAVDWDHDGDVDLWYHNRTGPRLRFMRNRTIHGNRTSRDWVMFRLVGTTSNRDAIGARVRVTLSDPAALPLQRTLTAGDGYLSQSSKWLHLGLGDDPTIQQVKVRWPTGQEEEFEGIASGSRYVIVEGTGTAVAANATRTIADFTPGQQAADTRLASSFNSRGASRLFLANPVPLPRLPFTNDDGEAKEGLDVQGRPVLVTLWASWCPSCLNELKDWTAKVRLFRDVGLDVLAMNVDGVANENKSKPDRGTQLLTKMDFPFSTGTATPEFLHKLEILQRITLNQTPSFAVPTSLLVDVEGRLCAIYRGPVAASTVLADVNRLEDSMATRRDAAVPFAGRWMSPPSTLLMRPVGQVFRDAGYVEDYSLYLELDQKSLARQRQQASDGAARAEFDQRYAVATFNLARSRQLEGQLDQAIAYYRQGLSVVDDSSEAHRYLAHALASRNEAEQAIHHYQRVRELNPSRMATYTSLARLHRDQEDHAASLEVLQAGLHVKADHVPTRFALALTLVALERTDDAIQQLRAVTQQQPNHADAWANLGNLLARIGNHGEAIKVLQKAIDVAPTNVAARLGLAGALAANGDLAAAVVQFQQVAIQQPDLAVAHTGLAQVLTTQSKWHEAVAEFEHAIRLSPRDGGSMLRLASLLVNCPDESVRNSRRAVVLSEQLRNATQGKDPRVLQVLAAAYALQGDYPRAVTVVDRALEIVGGRAPQLRTVLESQRKQYGTATTTGE